MSLDHAWMKGVPMDLRPRYYPKPPLKFKDIDIYIPLDAIENDYDFTEERRVLVECKMWEADKEKERLAEEEKQRQLEQEAERLRLEEEERKEQSRLASEANAAAVVALEDQAEDQDSSIAKDLKLKMNVGVEDNVPPEEDDNVVVPNHNSNSGSSKPNSPVSEDSSSSQANQQSVVETENVIPTPPLHHSQLQSANGYHQYMMGSDHQQMYQHQTVPQYYNYYVPPPHPQQVVPISMPMPQQQQEYPSQPQPNSIMHQPGTVSPGSGLPYPTNPQNSKNGPTAPVAPSMLQPTQMVTGPIAPAPTAPHQSATPAGGDSGSNSPAGSEKSSSGQSQQVQSVPPQQQASNQNVVNATAPSKKVDLKDLSDFESDTANPFDNVELKSINDMEMLASVLKNHVPLQNTNSHTAAPSPATVTPTPESQSAPAGSSSYINGGCSGRGIFHQPTPIYPSVSSRSPYPPQPSWNSNGFYSPVTASSAPVSTTSVPTSTAPTQQSHVPSPTQGLDQQSAPPQQATPTDSAVSGVNSFTKLHFPFLTSMAASSSRGNRDAYGSSLYNRSYIPQSNSNSTDDFTSQNPFLSSYVQSHSPLHQHQYWPSHLSHVPPQQQPQQNPFSAHHSTPVQNGPVQQSAPGAGFIPSGPSTAPPTGSQHALR